VLKCNLNYPLLFPGRQCIPELPGWAVSISQGFIAPLLISPVGKPFKVACIGPAGENLVRFASLMNDKHRAAGRSGVGAVMGSKNLKAIAVKGTGGVQVYDNTNFRALSLKFIERAKRNPSLKGLFAYGTAQLVGVINESGMLPTMNFRETQFKGSEAIGGEAIKQRVLLKEKSCFACPVACSRVTEVVNPLLKGLGEGPEYESTWALGAMCGVNDLDVITKANYLCNELGLDTISAGGTIACAMELFDIGVLKEHDFGFPANFGNGHAVIQLIEMIACRKGIGNELAEGSLRFAKKYRHEELSMSVKGQELAAYDPRGAQGMGLTYATSNRGGCHCRGWTIAYEVIGNHKEYDPRSTEDKHILAKNIQDMRCIVDSSGICVFGSRVITEEDWVELLNSATGVCYSKSELRIIGERIWNLERVFNLKAGFTFKDDTLPQRLTREPIPSGPMEGMINRLQEMLPLYYQIRGWDDKGVPKPEKLQELNLMDFVVS